MRRFIAIGVVMIALTMSALAEDFSFSADSMTGAMTKGRERAVLVGNALVMSGAMRISADRIELYGDDFRFADCQGHVSVIDEERGLKLSTERLVYDRRDKVSKLTGASVMEDSTNKVVIKADYIQNDDQRKIAVVQVNVRILKDKLSCHAEYARYDREARTLELSGSPTVTRDADHYSAAVILVNLDTEDIELVGSVSGTVAAGTAKEPAATPAGTPDAPAGAPGP